MNRRAGVAREGDAFSDRVMAAIALVASPSPTRSFLEAVRSGAGRDAAAALSVAWHLGTADDSVGPRVRARSLALVIAVASILASGSLVAASAARVIVPHVDRSKILLPSGSVIVDGGGDSAEPTGPDGRRPRPVTVPTPVVIVVSTKADTRSRQTGRDRHGPASTAPAAHGTTSAHADQPGDGGAGRPNGAPDGGDTADESGQGHDASDDGGHDQGDDGSDVGTRVDGSADGGDQEHQGDSGSGGDDGHQADDQGDASGD